jgi:hypothetical protein
MDRLNRFLLQRNTMNATTVALTFEDGEEAMDGFIVEWLALESASPGRPGTWPTIEKNRQAV